MMRKIIVLMVIVVIGAGCSPKPSENQMEKLFSSMIEDGFGNIVEVRNFTKIDGLLKDQQTYVVDVAYDMVWKVSLGDVERMFREDNKDAGFVSAAMIGILLMKIKFGYGDFKAGDKHRAERQLTFIKKDSGWVLTEMHPDFF